MAKPQDPEKMDLDTEKPATADDIDDPITATYPVFLNPSLPSGRRLLVLQQPNRTDDHPRPPPTELRLKTGAGMVEVDMPIDSTGAYDREKGLRWGRDLHNSTAAKSGGSHGLAGGFGFGAVQQRGGGGSKKKAAELLENEELMMDWNEAVRQGKALTTQTLGGQYPEVGDVQYMVGVFQGKNLHLTPVSSLVHLRPQLHHIDAANHIKQQNSSKDSGASGSSAGAGAGASASGGAKAIHMTIKTTGDGERVTTETMADRLRAVQGEPWRSMRYTDENDEAAWDVYNESLFLRSRGENETEKKEKNKEGEPAPEEPELEEAVPRFATKWGDKELLEAVSGIKKPDPEQEPEVKEPETKQPQPQKGKQPEASEAAPRPRTTRTRGGAAAARRGGTRAKTSSKAGSSTVDID